MKMYISYNSWISKSPCHTKPRFHCVGTELFNFPEHREIARKPWHFSWKKACHGVLTATKALLRSSHGVLSRSNGVIVGDSLRFHDAFTALSRRSQCMHCTFTAFALRWRHVEDVLLHNRTKSSSVVCLFSKLKPCHFGTAGPAYRQAGVQLAGVRRT